jgi:hypothetical protein
VPGGKWGSGTARSTEGGQGWDALRDYGGGSGEEDREEFHDVRGFMDGWRRMKMIESGDDVLYWTCYMCAVTVSDGDRLWSLVFPSVEFSPREIRTSIRRLL